MTETEFLARAEAVLEKAERMADEQAERFDIEIDASRAGNVLSLEFDDGRKIIINSQAPLQEIWVAAKSGGFHFRLQAEEWRDTRAGTELFEALIRLIQIESTS